MNAIFFIDIWGQVKGLTSPELKFSYYFLTIMSFQTLQTGGIQYKYSVHTMDSVVYLEYRHKIINKYKAIHLDK